MHTKKLYFTAFQSVISVVMLFLSLSLNAQTDSLQGKSYEELVKLFDAVLYTNPTNAETYALAANRIAARENNQKELGNSLYSIATSKYYLGKFDEAFKFTDQSLIIAKTLKDDTLLFKNYNLRGNILSDSEKEFKALDQYILAKKYVDIIDDPIQIITVSVNIAYLKKLHYDHQEALDILKDNLKLIDKIPENHPKKQLFEHILLMNIADTYLRIKNPKEAAYYNDIGMNSCKGTELSIACLIILMNDAIINYQLKDYDKAITISEKVKRGFIELKSENQLVTPYFYLGKSFFQKKQYTEAILNIENAIQISVEKKVAFNDQKEAHKILYQSYTEIGNTKKATENFTNYSNLDNKNDSIDIQLNNKIHKKYDIVPLQEEIDSLDTTNQKQQKHATYLYIISALLLVSLIVFFIWFKQKQQQNKTRFQHLLLQIEKLEEPKEKVVPETIIKETSNPVTDENALQILKALAIFEEKELYLRQDCTLAYVAKKAKTNTTYLSNVINTYKEKPFKSYLSELRINAALVKLKNDEKLRSYTIKAIAEEFGFKRSETFSRAFKAQTDVYPSYYIKSLQNQKNI